ncbi:MAG: sensor histidine kinase [Thermomicrobiales bacterium]
MRRFAMHPPWQSLRLRLTLWYVALLAAILLAFSGILSVRLNTTLHDNLDDTLRNRADLLIGTITSDNGRLALDPTRLPVDQNQGEHFSRLYNAAGDLVSSDTTGIGTVPSLPDDVTTAERGVATIRSIAAGGTHLRVLTTPLQAAHPGVLQIGLTEDDIRDTITTQFTILATLLPIMLLVASGGGLFLASRALAPVDRIIHAAHAIEATGLHERLPEPPTQDEIGRLARTLNALIGRLEAAFTRQRQFTADASHELRTPLTIMQGELDVTLRRERTAREYQATLIEVREQVVQLQRLTADLLLLARDDGSAPPPAATLDLALVVKLVHEQLLPLATSRAQTVTVVAPHPVIVNGVASDLERLIRNLVENAIRYTPTHGTITMTARAMGSSASVTVSDTGVGIDATALPHLFDRFYRADSGRNRAAGGTGLGLAIAQSIARRHKGAITVESVVGEGSIFTVTLPLVADAADPASKGAARVPPAKKSA